MEGGLNRNIQKPFMIFVPLISIVAMAEANPVPGGLPASMPLEGMYSYLEETNAEGLRKTLVGHYYLSYIPKDVTIMKYHLPPKSEGISVAMGRLPRDWQSSHPFKA